MDSLVIEPPPVFGGVFRGATVVVTGHMGFKGGWLSLWLRHLGAVVHGYSLKVPSTPGIFTLARIGEVVGHHVGDVRDLDRLRGLLSSTRPRFLFHLAAQPIVSRSYADPLETFSSNAIGTATVLEALRTADWPCAAVIVTSDKCYQNSEWPWGYRETDQLGGSDPYSASKAAAELVTHAYLRSFFAPDRQPVRIATARAGNVIGGGDFGADRIVADCVVAWSQSLPVRLRSPKATRPWQHVLEPLSGYLALARALTSPTAPHGEAFNFGPAPGPGRQVVELIEAQSRHWQLPPGVAPFEVIEAIPFREARLLTLACDKAHEVLHWRPTLTFEECVAMTGVWYRDVLHAGADARAATEIQIGQYESLADARGVPWCKEITA